MYELNQVGDIKRLKATMFVPAHAEVTDNIQELVQTNIDKVLEIADKIAVICKEPICFEGVLQKLFHAYALVMNLEQYVLVGSTVRSYLSWLKDAGRLEVIFENGQLLWQAQ